MCSVTRTHILLCLGVPGLSDLRLQILTAAVLEKVAATGDHMVLGATTGLCLAMQRLLMLRALIIRTGFWGLLLMVIV